MISLLHRQSSRTLIFRNDINQVCYKPEVLDNIAKGIAESPGFDKFAEKFDDKEIKRLKEQGTISEKYEKVKEAQNKFQNPEKPLGLQ